MKENEFSKNSSLFRFCFFISVGICIFLAGCADLKPTQGMSLAQLNSMSARSGNQYLVLVKKSGDFEIYQSGSVVQRRQMAESGSLVGKAMYDPKTNVFYIIKNGYLFKTADSEYELNKFLNDNEEMRRLGFKNQTDYEFGKSIGANGDQVNQLQKLGINNYLDFQKVKDEYQKNKSVYGNQESLSFIIQFVLDKKTAESQKLTIAQVVENRRIERAKLLKKQQEEEAKRLADLAKEFPFEAVLSCGIGGNHINIMACFVGGRASVNTQLEIRNGQQYRMYQGWELGNLGKETREGLTIPLRKNFSLVAQNSSDTLILNLTVRDTLTKNIVYTKSAARFDVISLKN